MERISTDAQGPLWPCLLSRLLSGLQVGRVQVLRGDGAALGRGDGAPLQTLEGHSDLFNSVALEGHSGGVNSVAFSPGGKMVHTLLLSDNWLMEGVQKLIWLHPDHRGYLKGGDKGTVVLAQSSGRILIMRFKSGPRVGTMSVQCFHIDPSIFYYFLVISIS